MSKIANDVYNVLKELFPLNVIKKEHYVRFKCHRLFFDFFIMDLRILIEVQGQQHSKFIKHFHVDKHGFAAQKKRDNLKIEYAEDEGLAFVKFYYDDDISKEFVINKIYSCLRGS